MCKLFAETAENVRIFVIVVLFLPEPSIATWYHATSRSMKLLCHSLIIIHQEGNTQILPNSQCQFLCIKIHVNEITILNYIIEFLMYQNCENLTSKLWLCTIYSNWYFIKLLKSIKCQLQITYNQIIIDFLCDKTVRI